MWAWKRSRLLTSYCLITSSGELFPSIMKEEINDHLMASIKRKENMAISRWSHWFLFQMEDVLRSHHFLFYWNRPQGIKEKTIPNRKWWILSWPSAFFFSFFWYQSKEKEKRRFSGLCLTRSHIFPNLFFLLVQRINKEKNFRWTIKRKKIWKENVWAWAISHLLFARHLQMNAYAHGQTDGWRSYAHDPRLNVVFLDPIVGKSFRAWLLMSR